MTQTTSLFNYRHLLTLIFTYLHTDLVQTPDPRFETTDVDLFFTSQVQKKIHPNLLKKYVFYKLPSRYLMEIEIENPLIYSNTFLPGCMYIRTKMFSDIIPLVLGLLTSSAIKEIGTYRKILIRRFMQLQNSSFNYWNEFLKLINKPIILNLNSYEIRNNFDRYFVNQFIEGVDKSQKLSFYLNYTGDGIRTARLLYL